MPSLLLSNVRKTYAKGVVALDAVNLSIADGECFVLLGPSGAGKSTLLRLIAGLERLDSGSIQIDGRGMDDLPPHRRGVAFAAQRPALYPHLSVADNLTIGLKLEQLSHPRRERLSATAIRQRADNAAELLHLQGLLTRYPHELSGGEQHRVSLGRALVRGARLWLLDEPLGQLDAPLRSELCHELHLLRRQVKATILYVTHDPIEATALADRIGVLGGGRLLQAGTAAEVYARPGNRTAALCLGWPPMNFIDGRAEPASGSGFCFRAGAWTIAVAGARPLQGPMTLGIRPEDLNVRESGPLRDDIPLGTWEVVALQPGSFGWLLTLEGPSGPLVGWWKAERPVAPGMRLAASVALARAHWFDGVSGERLPESGL
jgi:ABC-type sugar transport system ATPase subunit